MSGYVWAPWQGATNCTDGPTDGARHLLAWLLESFPAGSSLGIYNCRTVRGGSTTSLHGEGRAVDYAMPRDPDGTGSPAGRRIVDRLGPHGLRLGIQAVIYDRTIWSARSPAGRYYTGTHPHYDHLHVELTWAAARALNLATLRAVAGGPEEGQMITKGDKGNAVKLLQRALEEWRPGILETIATEKGNPAWGEIDGIAGDVFVEAVRRYQRAADLEPTGNADGVTCAFLRPYVHGHGAVPPRLPDRLDALEAVPAGGGITRPEADGRYALKGHGHPPHDHPVTVDGRTGKG